MKNKKIIIAGGSGFIGQALAAHFGKENHIIILGRQSAGTNNSYSSKTIAATDGYNITYWRWDGTHVEKHWANDINGADLVINLAGKSVNCRYTSKNKKEIFDSRINATKAIGEAIRQAAVPPKLWINAASATIYRHAEDHPQDEYNGEFKNDFSVQVCKLWELTFNEEITPLTRKVALRTAITLGNGGVMVPYFNLLKFGLGGHQGNGKQMYSWVHIEDVCRAVEWIFEHPEMTGTYNLSSPNPVTNKKFMQTLRQVTQTKIGLPATKWMLNIGAALIGTEAELILKSRWVLPARLTASGFQFTYPELTSAVKAIVAKTAVRNYRLF